MTSDSDCTSFSSAWMPLSSTCHQVVEGEHVVHDLLREVVVGLADVVEHRGLDAGAHQVEHLGRGLDAAERGLAHLVAAGQQLAHDLVQVLQRRRLDAVERGDAHHAPRCAAARCRSFSTAEAWSESRWTRIAATICGCSSRSSSADRRRRPSTSGSRCRRRRCSAGCGRSAGWPCPRRAPSSAPSARRRRCRRRACAVAGDACVNFSSTLSTRSRGIDFIRAIVSPRPCTSFGVRCLNTSAASSSPSDISRMAASLESGLVHRCGSAQRAGAAASLPSTQPRTMPATAAGLSLRQLARALDAARRCGLRRARAAAGSEFESSAIGVEARRRAARRRLRRRARRLACAGRTRPKKTSRATIASAAGNAAARTRSIVSGLLPQRRLDRRRAGGLDLERRVDDLDRIAALLA